MSDAATPPEPAPRSSRLPAAAGDRPRGLELAVVAGFVAIGVVLRFATTSALWLDEALSVHLALLGPGELVEALRADGHPPLYYLLLDGWIRVVGDGDVAVRSLSGVLSVATLPLVWWWTRRRAGAVAAAWALALLAVLPYATRYGTEARMYALVMFLVAAGTIALARLLERPGAAPAALVALLGAALLYSHYWSLWLLAVVGAGLVWVAWRGEDPGHRRGARWGVGALVVAGLAFVPWLPVLFDQLAATGTPWADPVRPSAALSTTLLDVVGGPLASETGLAAAGLAVLIVFGLTGRSLGRGRVEVDLATRPTVRLEVAVAVAALTLGAAGAWVARSAFASRYAAIVVTLVVVAAGAGAATISGTLRRTLVVGALGLGLLGIGVVGVVDQRTQAGVVAEAVAAAAGPDDVVVVCPDQLGPALRRELPDTITLVRYPDLGDPRFVDWRDYEARNLAVDPATVAADIDELARTGTVWLAWMGGYRTFGTDCEQMVNSLAARRGVEGVVTADGERYFEPMSLFRFPGG